MGWFSYTMPKDRLARHRMPVADTTSTAKAMAYALVNAVAPLDQVVPVTQPAKQNAGASAGTLIRRKKRLPSAGGLLFIFVAVLLIKPLCISIIPRKNTVAPRPDDFPFMAE
ncbi:hypothetical protein J9Z47_003546 [Salmonella enterica]|nr:hypothetical protein [Salmonella enterica]